MFEYIDSDSLSTEDKILYLINDMEELRGAIGMIADEAEASETRKLLDAADEKVEKAIEDLDAAVLTEREAE
ncbi:MAG: hypothetical protein IJ899_05660 [Blautia sp.]|nr:hypothetical protein [Blautia sp.]